MNNPASANAIQSGSPDQAKKVWTKPVLDILELESAQHGSTHIPDGVYRHRSG